MGLILDIWQEYAIGLGHRSKLRQEFDIELGLGGKLKMNTTEDCVLCIFFVVVVVVVVFVCLFVFKRFIYLFYVYECTVAVFRHTRIGHQIPLQIVVSHHVVSGN